MAHSAAAPIYDNNFFSERSELALESARVITPVVLRYVKPHSVIDVGCGCGEWLKVFQDLGVTDIQGIDGDYVEQSQLLIPQARFRAADLNQPVEINREYDLAICLEVAEHVAPSSGQILVKNLVKAAPLILFSAAIPGQGGIGHINEQWPKYWQLAFAEHDYVRLDVIRPSIWQDRRVAWWYQQNVFLFASPEAIAKSEILRRAAKSKLELVNKKIFERLTRLTSVRGILHELPYATGRMLRNRLHRWRIIRK